MLVLPVDQHLANLQVVHSTLVSHAAQPSQCTSTYLRSGLDDVVGCVEIVFGEVVGALVVLILQTGIRPVVK